MSTTNLYTWNYNKTASIIKFNKNMHSYGFIGSKRTNCAVLHTKKRMFPGKLMARLSWNDFWGIFLFFFGQHHMHNDEYNTDPIRCRYWIMHLLMRQFCVRENHVGSRITMQLSSLLKGKIHWHQHSSNDEGKWIIWR